MGEFQLIAPREDNHEYYVEHHPNFGNGGCHFVTVRRISDLAPIPAGRTFRLVAAPVSAAAQRSNWQELIRNRPAVMLSRSALFPFGHLVLFEREDGLPFLRVIPLAEPSQNLLAASYRIEFNEPAYNAAPRWRILSSNKPISAIPTNLSSRRARFSILRSAPGRALCANNSPCSAATTQLALRQRETPLRSRRTTRASQSRSSIRKRHATGTPGAPLLLYGYGSYGISLPVNFSSNRLSLLDRGVIYAIAHIRGGGELGKAWHDAGRMHQKKNTFADFRICVRGTLDRFEGFTSNGKKLIIEGGSAGGLLMGAVSNLRPDLFHAVISHVPFVDVLNTMLDARYRSPWASDEEWGNPQIAEDYFYIKSYCPYTNLEAKAYPAMLVKTGLNDSQVMYWEPAKYVAKLRRLKSDSNPLLFKINMGAGHGGASGRYDYLPRNRAGLRIPAATNRNPLMNSPSSSIMSIADYLLRCEAKRSKR